MTEDENARTRSFASPACAMGESDPAYFGYLSNAETASFLNLLLEAERAGAKGVAEMAKEAADPAAAGALRGVAADEARFCAMLHGHIRRLGAPPSEQTGDFIDKLRAEPGLKEKLALLDRGQGWVTRKIRETLPRIRDDALHRDLADMAEVHDRNIARCAGLPADPGHDGGQGNTSAR